MNRIIHKPKQILNSTLSNLDDFYVGVGREINVYKFRKVSGMIRMTNFGEKSLYKSNTSFQQTTNIYTGKEPITVVWENSTKVFTPDNRKIHKKFQVGTYYKCYSAGANTNSLITDNTNILNKEYVNTYIDRSIQVHSVEWIPNEDDMLEYVYLIIDDINKSNQWLEISSVSPIYNEETGKIQYCEINFNNINLKYANTGKTLLDFLQFGGIGEGYAFPKETINENGEIVVELDVKKKKRENDGTNQIQFDFNSGAGNSSFLFFGRKKEKEINENLFEIEAPHILLPYLSEYPKQSPFFFNRPNLNSYAIIGAKPTKRGIWESYKEAYKGNNRIGEYNINKQKEVMTGFEHNVEEVRNSNKNMSSYINWDNKKNIYFKRDLDLRPIAYVDERFNRIDRWLSPVEFFTINAFLNFYTDVFNYDYKETTKFKLTDLVGILGGLVNILVGGLDIGWTKSSTLGPNQPLNFLLPCISFEDGKAALSEKAPLPIDVFIDDNIKKVLPTSTNVLTSWNFQLTDRFVDNNLIIPNRPLGKGGNGVWDTKYLGQKTDEDGNLLLPDGKELKLNLQTFQPAYPSTTEGFIIDYVDFKTIGICDYRISAYNTNGENIYSCYMETNAKARDEITLWGNSIKFNYYNEFNSIGNAEWPKLLDAPKPSTIESSYKLTELNNYPAFSIDGKFGEINSGDGWNGETSTYLNTISTGCSPVGGCNSLGDYRRYFKPDNGNYLFKDNLVVNKQVKCNISTLNINLFKSLRITFFDNTYIELPLSVNSGTKTFTNYWYFPQTYNGIYSGSQVNGQKGGILNNTRDKPTLPKYDIIAGKDKCLLCANTNNVKIDINFTTDFNFLTINMKTTYQKVLISLQEQPTDLKHDYFKSPRGQTTSQYDLGGDFKDLFSNYQIKNAILIPK